MFKEMGPRVVMACATLPTMARSRMVGEETSNEAIFRSGIGSQNWVVKRWFPHALRIMSKWMHRQHPGLVETTWVHIDNERKPLNYYKWKYKMGKQGGTGSSRVQRNNKQRLKKLVETLKDQDPKDRTLVFAYSPDMCDKAVAALSAAEISCRAFHARVPVDERLDLLRSLAEGEVVTLVCTDIAARGLDIPAVRHVVQLEMAGNTTDYLHRVGRAARAGRPSRVTNFVGGDADKAIRQLIEETPAMGLTGEVLHRNGNRNRIRRTRKKQRKTELEYGDLRMRARLARDDLPDFKERDPLKPRGTKDIPALRGENQW